METSLPCSCVHYDGCPLHEHEVQHYVATAFVRGGIVQAWATWDQ